MDSARGTFAVTQINMPVQKERPRSRLLPAVV